MGAPARIRTRRPTPASAMQTAPLIARLVGKREFESRLKSDIHGLVGAVPWVEMGARYGPWREPTLFVIPSDVWR